jgi:Tfp pilus assembly major pilin PilA
LALAELGRNLLGISVIAIVAILAALPIALNQEQSAKADLDYHTQLLGGLNEQLQQVCLLLNLEAENQLISDRTKAVAFREKDHDTIRRAVQEEIARQDWEAALALANDMDSVFGYKSEADRFRQEISSKRQDSVQKQITEQMAIVDRYTNAEAWAQALQEAQRIIALHPNDERLMHLPQEIEARRQACKKKLMGTWNEAVERHDVDGSIEILKHLDMYLTPAEAEGMQEKARSVFKEKIGLLRMQFTMAVQDKRWAEAIRLGDSIVAEFPNTRMAQEVRDMMEMLRQRAGDGNVAKV